MSILIIGNILKDVYLSLDSRTESIETDNHHTKWLDFSFDTSKHHFFHRTSTFGGAAVSLEVLKKLGLDAKIMNSGFTFDEDGAKTSAPAGVYRYILTIDDGVSYLVPSEPKPTRFTTPTTAPDYLYIDRSAYLDDMTASSIKSYLTKNPATAPILYVNQSAGPALADLLPLASLVIVEKESDSAISDAPASHAHSAPEQIHSPISAISYAPTSQLSAALDTLSSDKIIYLSETSLSYGHITEPISVERIDTLTHLSAYSIAAATILGSFILGKSVEDSLKMARRNVEGSTLSSTLSLAELDDDAASTGDPELIAATLMVRNRGILAADESGGSIKKKFAQLEIADTPENRHAYRDIFFTTPDIEKYLSGVILFDETARDHMADGQTIPEFLTAKRIIPGIKVDQGLEKFLNSAKDTGSGKPLSDETYTKGLDGLSDRLEEYYSMGLRFAKWRAAFELHLDDDGRVITPTLAAITENCRILAEYARLCQAASIVPIVEPEVVYDGDYSIEKCAEVTGNILDSLFTELEARGVNLRACILKCNMVLAGKKSAEQSTPAEVGAATAKTLKSHVPKKLAGIVFLSGGQTPEQATANLAAIMANGPFPWPITFSFARALQDPALFTWKGNEENVAAARTAFSERLIKNAEALHPSA